MFGIGIIKGTMIGIGIGMAAGLTIKKICKMKKTISSNDVEKNNENK